MCVCVCSEFFTSILERGGGRKESTAFFCTEGSFFALHLENELMEQASSKRSSHGQLGRIFWAGETRKVSMS